MRREVRICVTVVVLCVMANTYAADTAVAVLASFCKVCRLRSSFAPTPDLAFTADENGPDGRRRYTANTSQIWVSVCTKNGKVESFLILSHVFLDEASALRAMKKIYGASGWQSTHKKGGISSERDWRNDHILESKNGFVSVWRVHTELPGQTKESLSIGGGIHGSSFHALYEAGKKLLEAARQEGY